MALAGGALFVANGKKLLQQPACLGLQGRSAVYRVGVQITADSPALVTLTVQLRGSVDSAGSACCAAAGGNGTVINLDVHQELVETLPVSRSVVVLDNKFPHLHVDSHLFCLGGGSHFLFRRSIRITERIPPV